MAALNLNVFVHLSSAGDGAHNIDASNSLKNYTCLSLPDPPPRSGLSMQPLQVVYREVIFRDVADYFAQLFAARMPLYVFLPAFRHAIDQMRQVNPLPGCPA